MKYILLRCDAVSVGQQFLMFQRITVPSFSGVQKAVIVSFETNEPVTQCHIPQELTLRLLMSYIYGAPSKARNANVVYIWTYVWQR